MPLQIPRRFLVALMVLSLSAPALGQQPAPAKPADVAKQLADLQQRILVLEAQGETNALAIAQLSSRLAELVQQLEVVRAGQTTSPELIDRVDETAVKTAELERVVEELRTQLADLEQPYVASTGGGTTGMTLGSGDFTATFSGYFQMRWQLLLPRRFDTITESTFRIRRGRLGVKGNAGSMFDKKIRYKLLAELLASPSLRDYYADVEIKPELIVRVGQQKLPHIRKFITSSTGLLFPERSIAVNSYRYDRDLGIWIHGVALDGKLGYHAGIANGSGENVLNDNIDFAVSARVDGVALGERFGLGYGDSAHTATPSLMVGASAVHDLVRLPESVSGIPVPERDVDSDAVLDNIRVLSLAADATFRRRGLEVALEGLLRRESWGTILEHSANEDLASLVNPDASGNKTYVGVTGQVSYFVVPKMAVVGARVAYSDQTYLRLGRSQSSAVPPGDTVVELELTGQLYRKGHRLVGLQYSLTNFNAAGVVDPANDLEHRFIIESNLLF